MSERKTINAAQNSLYWREWGNLKKACKNLNFREPDRHELHVRALGVDKSHTDFDNNDLDKVLAEFRALSQPTNVSSQLRQIQQPASRIIYLVQHDFRASLAILLPIKYGKATLPLTEAAQNECPNFYLADAYLKSVLKNRFKTDDINALNQEPKRTSTGEMKSQLEMYRDTLARCISQARQKLGITVHDLNILAGLPCDCKDCNAGIIPTVPCLMQPHHEEELAAVAEVGDESNPF